MKQVVMAYFGVQYRSALGRQAAREGLAFLRHAATLADGPRHHDLAFAIDEAGYDTLVWAAYWTDPASFERWQRGEELSRWWNSADRLEGPCGWFYEVAMPEVERFETLFSTVDRPEGVAHLAPSMSGAIREHAYWGSMRDRLPASQFDALRGSGARALPVPGRRVRLGGFENLALIRSGQDWSDTKGQERRLYLQQIEPQLREGMDFLRDGGADVGCLSNRYLVHVDEDFAPVERSYGLSMWRDLGHMERWAESHPTHAEIFGAFMQTVQKLEFQLDLRLYHEVSVVSAACQSFEYLNCHPKTGLLRLA
ncbi:phenylacetaldoxime dehydratase family protein [Piscinibacter sp.]|uniref:phenylacetaldoxime dehydratase family protein n=1 Tax=Piscinibacter sp. TaxID=1903157 RepID=UPI002BB7528E|nr:phenylacetaldoxime dehydratase family protein [Albitalea sp.]HUG26075.1 phenylacetaldoxime dehydratase family protein [Albitalea sp.]